MHCVKWGGWATRLVGLPSAQKKPHFQIHFCTLQVGGTKSLWKSKRSRLSVSRLCDGGHAPTHTKENVMHGQGQISAAGEDTKFCSLCDKLYNEPLWPMKRRNENRQPGFQAGSCHTARLWPGQVGTARPHLPLMGTQQLPDIPVSEAPSALGVQNKSVWTGFIPAYESYMCSLLKIKMAEIQKVRSTDTSPQQPDSNCC